MQALVRDPADEQAIALVAAKDPGWNATLRTTCVATMLEPGTRDQRLAAAGEGEHQLTASFWRHARGGACAARRAGGRPGGQGNDARDARGPSSPPPPLTREILAPVEKLAAQFWPGVAGAAILQPGATDGQFLNAAGIPTYGIERYSGPRISATSMGPQRVRRVSRCWSLAISFTVW